MRTPVLDLFRPAVYLLCRAYFGLRLIGVENIPATGPLVITPNHQTYADPPLVTIPVRRPVHYMAWSALFTIPLFSRFIRMLRAFPVDIDRQSAATRQVVALLKHGEAVMIFPEGGRSPDGTLQPFKLGAYRLAVAHGASVLPVTIHGGTDSWPPGRWLPRPARITITYHAPLRAVEGVERKLAAQDLADRAQAAIASTLRREPTEEPEGASQPDRSSMR